MVSKDVCILCKILWKFIYYDIYKNLGLGVELFLFDFVYV